MGKAQRSKGQRGEREAIGLIKHLYPHARRQLEFQSHVADEGKDIANTGFMDIQVKVGNQVPKTIYTFMEQIKRIPGQVPVVFCKRDRSKWHAILELDDFIELLEIIEKHTGKL